MLVYVSNSPSIIKALEEQHGSSAKYICTHGPLFDLPLITDMVGVDIINDFLTKQRHVSDSAKRTHEELLNIKHLPVFVVTTPTLYGRVFAYQIAQILGCVDKNIYVPLNAVIPRYLHGIPGRAQAVNPKEIEAYETRRVIERMSSFILSQFASEREFGLKGIDYYAAFLLGMMFQHTADAPVSKYIVELQQSNGFKATLVTDSRAQKLRAIDKSSVKKLALEVSHGVNAITGTVATVHYTPTDIPTLRSVLHKLQNTLFEPVLDHLELLYYRGLICHPYGDVDFDLISEQVELLDGELPNIDTLPIIPLVYKDVPSPLYKLILEQWLDAIRPEWSEKVILTEFNTPNYKFVGMERCVSDDWRNSRISGVSFDRPPVSCDVELPIKIKYRPTVRTSHGITIQQLPYNDETYTKFLRSLDKLVTSNLAYVESGMYYLTESGVDVASVMVNLLNITKEYYTLNELLIEQVRSGELDKTFALRSWFHNFKALYEGTRPGRNLL